MGVAGTGKSYFGEALAKALGASFIEGDDHHSLANRNKMAAGIALTDTDRWPWLDQLADAVRSTPGHVVFSCSALRRRYREFLHDRLVGLKIICLHGDSSLIEQRISQRPEHFMPTSQLANQLQTLELPVDEANVLMMDIDQPIAKQIEQATQWLDR